MQLSSLIFRLCLVAVAGSACSANDQRAPRKQSVDHPSSEIWLSQGQVTAANLLVEPLALQPVGGLVVTSGSVTFDDLKVAHVMSPVTGRVITASRHRQRQSERRWPTHHPRESVLRRAWGRAYQLRGGHR
jgi:hypothetical protein